LFIYLCLYFKIISTFVELYVFLKMLYFEESVSLIPRNSHLIWPCSKTSDGTYNSATDKPQVQLKFIVIFTSVSLLLWTLVEFRICKGATGERRPRVWPLSRTEKHTKWRGHSLKLLINKYTEIHCCSAAFR